MSVFASVYGTNAKFNLRYFFLVGDGRLGYPSEGPYMAIHVGAASEFVPQAVK